jgi:hypothetical protein
MSDSEMQIIEQMIPMLREAYKGGGWLALLPVLLPSLVQLFKSDFIQNLLPDNMKFANLKPAAQFGLAFGVAALPVFFAKAITSGVVAALVLSVSAGIASTVSYAKLLKPAGTSNTASKAIAYAPQTMRNTLGMVAKVDQAKINDWIEKIEKKRQDKQIVK